MEPLKIITVFRGVVNVLGISCTFTIRQVNEQTACHYWFFVNNY